MRGIKVPNRKDVNGNGKKRTTHIRVTLYTRAWLAEEAKDLRVPVSKALELALPVLKAQREFRRRKHDEFIKRLSDHFEKKDTHEPEAEKPN